MKKLDLNQTFVLNPIQTTGSTIQLTVFTDRIISTSGDTEITIDGDAVTFNKTLEPVIDNTINLGTPIKRFRSLNTVSGSTSYWAATVVESQVINTPILNLGFDMYNNYRVLTADSSVLSGDTLGGSSY